MGLESPMIPLPEKTPQKEAVKDLTAEGRKETMEMETLEDYLQKSSALRKAAESLRPGHADESHPYIKLLNSLGQTRVNLIDPVLAEEILPPDELALYQKFQKGGTAFGLTEQDAKEKSSDRWKEWSRGGEINEKIVRMAVSMETSGRIPDALKGKITRIPDALKQKLAESVKRGEELLKELKSLEGPGEKKTAEELGKDIAEAKSFDDLIRVVETHGGIQGSRDFFSAPHLKEAIASVRKGEVDIVDITRTGGLRKKVADLLAIEKRKV